MFVRWTEVRETVRPRPICMALEPMAGGRREEDGEMNDMTPVPGFAGAGDSAHRVSMGRMAGPAFRRIASGSA